VRSVIIEGKYFWLNLNNGCFGLDWVDLRNVRIMIKIKKFIIGNFVFIVY
jgi:hypothetical protein